MPSVLASARRSSRLLARLVLGAALALAAGAPAARADGDDGVDWRVLDRRVYETSEVLAPTHPVTGRPVLNVVPVDFEIRLAHDWFERYAEQARAAGFAIDPPGPRLARMRRILDRLVDVAHRPGLPWQVHLVDAPEANAFTAGGGLVVVLSGLFGDLVPEGDDDALAAVLAHEIAHVAMLHPPTRVTWLGLGGVVSPQAKDPYYRAAYTHQQEAEADRLSVLYLALAGFDPLAASRLWERAGAGRDEAAARAGFLHDHPAGAERVRITREAGHRVRRYWTPGQRHPRAREILHDNVLYQRAEPDGYRSGSGFVRAARALWEAVGVHRRAARSQRERIEAAQAQQRVRVLAAFGGRSADGDPSLVLDVLNGAGRPVSGMVVTLQYVAGGALVLIDECRAEVRIEPATVRPVTCPRQQLDAERIVPRVAAVRFDPPGP